MNLAAKPSLERTDALLRPPIRALLSARMNQPLRSRLKAAASAFASNAVNGNLRRAQLSFFGAWTAE